MCYIRLIRKNCFRGIVVEQNEKKFGTSSDDTTQSSVNNVNNEKFEEATGDASEILSEREEERGHHSTVDTDEHSVLVTSAGRGSKVTKTETFTNTSQGPGGVVYTYTKNTTIALGPHGEVLRNETSSYGNRQNALRRSNGHPVASQQVGSQTTSNRGSVHLTTDEVYEPPYSSVEYEVADPNIPSRSSSSHRQNQEGGSSGHYAYRGRGYGAEQGNYHQNVQQQGGQRSQDRYQSNYYHGGQNSESLAEPGRISHSTKYNRTYEAKYGQPILNAANLGHEGKVGFIDLGVVNRHGDESLVKGENNAQFTQHNVQGGRYDPDLDKIVYNTPRQQGGYKSRTFSEEKSGNKLKTCLKNSL